MNDVRKFMNLNMVLCQEYDSKTKSIYNIFNRIELDDNNRASFSLVSFLNIFTDNKEKVCVSRNFSLHYFLVKMDKQMKERKQLYLGCSYLELGDKDDVDALGEKMTNLKFNNIPFIGAGVYYIEAFYYDKYVSVKDRDKRREASKKIRSDGSLVSIASFSVDESA